MIRNYTHKDKSKVMALLRQNAPQYFASAEESDFEDYLDNEVEDYYVYEYNSAIIGAGGINYFSEERLARISWDMVDPKLHGNGIGKELIQYRINRLDINPNIDLIIVRTTQLVYRFYEKMGFELKKVEKHFWAKNFDLYEMQMKNNKPL